MTPRTVAHLWLVAALCGGGAAVAQTVPRAAPPSEALRPGDRVLVRIEGDPEIRDTFTVTADHVLQMPGFGDVSVAGVARSDVEPYLTDRLTRYLKRATVRARALVRLSIVGEVEKPGFYAVPADLVLTDAFMITGGPTREARITAIRIEREGVSLWRGDSLQRALASGYTVDQFRLRDGDRVVFPRQSRGGILSWVGVFLGIPATIFAIIQLVP